MNAYTMADIGESYVVLCLEVKMPKSEWVKNYANQVLQNWNGWHGPLKITDSHVKRLENRLDNLFETLETKVWIELIF